MSEYRREDTASWDAREVRRAEEHRPRKKRRRRVRLIPYLLFVLVMQSVYTLSSLSVHHNRPSPIAPILKLKAFLKSI